MPARARRLEVLTHGGQDDGFLRPPKTGIGGIENREGIIPANRGFYLTPITRVLAIAVTVCAGQACLISFHQSWTLPVGVVLFFVSAYFLAQLS
ncbi:MAG: hypothetical protein ACREL1_08860, partial [bacterium]